MAAPKFKVLQNREALENQTEEKGGGEYTPPAEGQCGLRLVGYVELGKHPGEYQGKPKMNDKVRLIFEISGKKWEPTKLETGEVIPQRISVNLNKSFTNRSAFYKLFLKMRDERGDIEHMADMLDEPFLGNIRHEKSEKTGKVFATLKDKDGVFTIRPPFIEEAEKDEEGELTGEVIRKKVKVGDAIGDYKLFIWNSADEEQWQSIYIPGEYDGKSKNYLQLEICKASNFAGSLAEALATESGVLDEAAKGVEGHDGDDDGESGDSEGANVKEKKADKPNKPKPTDKVEDAGEGGVDLNDID